MFGTVVSFDVANASPAAIAEVVTWLHEVERVFTAHRATSVVTRLGRGEISWDHPEVSAEVLEVRDRCLELRERTAGVFDPWAVEAPAGGWFDPSGFVKGWAIERATSLLVARGVTDACVNAGGDVALRGLDDGRPWRVAIRHPDDPASYLAVLDLCGPCAVATSATYERGAHLVDRRANRPADPFVSSATVVGADLSVVDALATTLFVTGPDGLADLAAFGCTGCVATRDGLLHTTPSFDALSAPLR